MHLNAFAPLFTVFLLIASVGLPQPLAAALPQPGAEISDTIPDPLTDLLARAREARTRSADGLESFEGVLREWIQVDLTSQRFRRSRSLFAQERMGRIRWHREETHIVQWEGAARALPLGEGTVNVRTDAEGDLEIDAAVGDMSGSSSAEDLARDLLRSGTPAPLFFDQGTDRLLFGPSNWALHPLADTASLHYRYELGDTLRLRLPERDAPIELVEVRVEPKEVSFRFISGILWIEPESGFLVRAAYRPSRPFDLRVDLENPPRFGVPSVQFEIRTVAVDHALFDFTWWVPWRYRFEGELRFGSLLRLPIVFEWSVSDLDVNEPASPALEAGGLGDAGWTVRVREREGRPPLEVRVAPPETLAQGARTLSGERIARVQGTGAFTPEEMARLETQIRALAPAASLRPPQLIWGFSDGLTRFNRVEGVSTGVRATLDLPRDRGIQATVRAGHADRNLRGELGTYWGASNLRGTLAVYRRLDPSSEWGNGHALGNSLATLLFRDRWTPFHKSQGGEIRLDRTGLQMHTALRLFGERQQAVPHNTDLRLWPWGERPEAPSNRVADPGTWWGGSVFLQAAPRSQWAGMNVATRSRVEAAGGTTQYARGWASASVRIPLPGPFQFAVESGGGTLAGDAPVQRHFLPGDVEIFRGIRAGEQVAERFTFRRAEIGAAWPPIGLVAFVDALHLRSPGSSTWSPREHAGGFGMSFADGIFRADVARPVGSGSPARWQDGWRVFFYLDGLF